MKIAALLGESEHQVSQVIKKLEDLSGYHSEDIKLLSENERLLRQKIASLGLDPHDTTSSELFYALKAKAESDLANVQRALQLKGKSRPQIAEAYLEVVRAHQSDREVLCVKNSSLKRLLRQHPPKKVMKELGYRSLDSIIKREEPGSLLALAAHHESTRWNEVLATKLSQLPQTSFEYRLIRFTQLPGTGLSETQVSYVPLAGTVVLWPKEDIKNRTLEIIFELFKAEEFALVDSFYLDQVRLSGHFKSDLKKLFLGEEPESVQISDHDFVNSYALYHLSHSDETAVQKLARIHPSLHWWRDTGSLAIADEGRVSMHLGDILSAISGGLSHAEANSTYAAHALRNMLLKKYYAYEGVKSYLSSQLDGRVISLDSVNANEDIMQQLQAEFI